MRSSLLGPLAIAFWKPSRACLDLVVQSYQNAAGNKDGSTADKRWLDQRRSLLAKATCNRRYIGLLLPTGQHAQEEVAIAL